MKSTLKNPRLPRVVWLKEPAELIQQNGQTKTDAASTRRALSFRVSGPFMDYEQAVDVAERKPVRNVRNLPLRSDSRNRLQQAYLSCCRTCLYRQGGKRADIVMTLRAYYRSASNRSSRLNRGEFPFMCCAPAPSIRWSNHWQIFNLAHPERFKSE